MNNSLQREPDLLDTLAQNIDCLYLSDLRSPLWAGDLERAVANVQAAAYSLLQWENAIDYITGGSVHFENQEQAQIYLCSFLRLAGEKQREISSSD